MKCKAGNVSLPQLLAPCGTGMLAVSLTVSGRKELRHQQEGKCPGGTTFIFLCTIKWAAAWPSCLLNASWKVASYKERVFCLIMLL